MSFVESLREARRSRAAVLHEFWSQYDPRRRRVHAFFEAHDDAVFFAPHIQRFLAKGVGLVTHRCEGKARVIEAFEEIVRRHPAGRHVLFFVDKDLDDVFGTPWPTDPRIFVTDCYSIENYVVEAAVFLRLYRATVRVTGVEFAEEWIEREFETQLGRFHRQLLTVMAWIVAARRAGARPMLNNVSMGRLWAVTTGGVVRAKRGQRLRELERAAGTSVPASVVNRVRRVARELAHVPAKRVLRGKYEIWFFVAFWRLLMDHMMQLAKEAGGKVQVRVSLVEGNVVSTVAPYVQTPAALDRFLSAHLSADVRLGENSEVGIAGRSWRDDVRRMISRWFVRRK